MPLRPDMDYRDYLEVLGRRKRVLVLSFIFVFFGAGLYLVVTPPLYKSTTTILVISQQVPYIQSTGNMDFNDRLATIEQQVTSRTRLMKVRGELNLLPGEGEKQSEEKVYKKMQKRIEVDILEDTSSVAGRRGGSKEGFSISYMDEDPKLAMLGANKLASLFIEESQKTWEQLAIGTSKLLESQLKETKAKLDEQEEKIRRYKMQNLGELPEELQTNLANLANLQDQYRVNSDGIRSEEQRKILLQSQLSMLGRDTQQTVIQHDGREEVDTSRASVQALVTELSNRRNQLAELTAKYTERHPDVIRLKQEVDQLEKKIAMIYMPPKTLNQDEKDSSNHRTYLPLGGKERQESIALRAQIASVDAEINTLKREREITKGKIVALQEKVNRVPRHEQELVALSRDYDNLKDLYNDLLRKKMDANITKDLEGREQGDQFHVLDPANLPEKPFEPKKKNVLLIAFLLASSLGFGGAIALEGADQTLHGTKDFQQFFKQKVLACIPDIEKEDLVRKKTFQDGAILAGILLFLAGVLAFLLLN